MNTKRKITIEAGLVLALSAALAWSGGVASALPSSPTPAVGQQSLPVGEQSAPAEDPDAPADQPSDE